jgi:hypothetical protein
LIFKWLSQSNVFVDSGGGGDVAELLLMLGAFSLPVGTILGMALGHPARLRRSLVMGAGMWGLRAGNDLREGGRLRAAVFGWAGRRIFLLHIVEGVRRRGRWPGVVHAIERSSRWPFLIDIIKRVFVCIMCIVLLLVVFLVIALDSHSAFNKRCEVEIIGLERVDMGWEAEGQELFATPCL